MTDGDIAALRSRIDTCNMELLELLQKRAGLVIEVAKHKESQGLQAHDPSREEAMLDRLAGIAEKDPGTFGAAQIRAIFRAIFRASLDLQSEKPRELRVRSKDLLGGQGVRVGNVRIGAGQPVVVAGPCSVESTQELERVASQLATFQHVPLLRAGAYKPRTNPYSFQGLREEGLPILRDVARRHGLATVTEVLDPAHVALVAEHVDMLQVGARSMYNSELLKELGRQRKPVLLKRGFMATLEELLLSAEYVLAGGNDNVVLCERGIRTFERSTRNTLDLAAVPLLKTQTQLPVLVDLSHALGRRDMDILLPCARAALACGADGLMVEVHDHPDTALSDSFQQIDPHALTELLRGLGLADRRQPREVTSDETVPAS